jgi:hypothetical protein
MTTIPRPNKDALIKVIDIYRDAMRPFLIHHLRQVPGRRLEEAIRQALRDNQVNQFDQNLRRGRSVEESIDINDFPELVRAYWRDTFSNRFPGDRIIQNRLYEIKSIRDEVSHPEASDVDEEKTRAHIYMVADVLGKIGRAEEKGEVEKIREELFAASRPESIPLPEQPQATQGTFEEIPTPGGNELSAWRDVIRPNEDVTEGRFRQAEFAASLQRVYDGRARGTEYGNAVSFFKRAYITPGMRALLVNTVQRLNGSGGYPVIQTKTGFGGGKTHSLIALYHLVRHAHILIDPPSGSDSNTSREIRNILDEAGFTEHPSRLGEIAVLDGTHLSPTDQKKTDSGDPLNTLWGEMAYQIGGQQGYEIVGEAARTGIAPGQAQLDALFEHVGPCVVLIDELVAYWRNDVDSERVFTFLQALTQSVSASKDAALVVTLPESQEEAGGERGMQALETLGRLFARIEAIWEPPDFINNPGLDPDALLGGSPPLILSRKSPRAAPRAAHKGQRLSGRQEATLPITLDPPNSEDFRSALLRTKKAWITVSYQDGGREVRPWNATRMKPTSNIIGNLRSRPEFRNGAWQKHGIASVRVSIEHPDSGRG